MDIGYFFTVIHMLEAIEKLGIISISEFAELKGNIVDEMMSVEE